MAQEPVTLLQNKRILLGVTGSIAVYKAVDLASKLTQTGAAVDVIMTQAALKFVTPLTFQAVTGRPVYTSMWQTDDQTGSLPTHIAHVGLGESADLMIIAPATAHTIARLAHGLADDLLAVTALAVRCPIIVAPAMDGGMYQHPATQSNISTLQARGVTLIEPEVGRFASGLVGKGRFPDTPALLGTIRQQLGRNGILAGRQIIVTAGGTREPLDPVRYLTNHSSGKQGYAVAQAAIDAGAEVILISAAQGLPVPVGASLVPVTTANDMLAAVLTALPGADALIMAAAVADFRPGEIAGHKIKKSADSAAGLTLNLARNPDILREVKTYCDTHACRCLRVGFAAESQDLLANAQHKLTAKGLDMIVANDITAPDAGFGVDTNRATILSADGTQESIGLTSKALIGERIIARVAELLNGGG